MVLLLLKELRFKRLLGVVCLSYELLRRAGLARELRLLTVHHLQYLLAGEELEQGTQEILARSGQTLVYDVVY